MLETTTPAFMDFILAVHKHDFQLEFTHGPSDLSRIKGAYNNFLEILLKNTDPLLRESIQDFYKEVQKCGAKVLQIWENNPGTENSETFLYYDAVANHRLVTLQVIHAAFSTVYTPSQILYMEAILQLLQITVDENIYSMDPKMETSKVIHKHLMQVAIHKENSPLMWEVELLLQSNHFNRNR
jgi:hypothetical protein